MSIETTVIHEEGALLVEHIRPEIMSDLVAITTTGTGGDADAPIRLIMPKSLFGRMLFSAMHYFFASDRPMTEIETATTKTNEIMAMVFKYGACQFAAGWSSLDGDSHEFRAKNEQALELFREVKAQVSRLDAGRGRDNA